MSFGMFDEATDPLEIDEDESKASQAKEVVKRRGQELRDLRDVLRYPQGRRVLFRIMMQCNPFANPFNRDANATAYNCGLQAAGRWLFNEINEARTGAFDQMRNEYEAALNNKKKEEEAP